MCCWSAGNCASWCTVVLLQRDVSFLDAGMYCADICSYRLLLFLIFFPRGVDLPTDDPEERKQYTWQTAVGVAFLCLLHGLVVIILSAALLISRPDHLGTWANVLGITATILAGIQYLPQIWMTWHLGHVGSLSIPMMLIQTPGSFVWSASLAARLGVEGWSTWGVFLVTGCLQGCLLAMGIYFEIQARNASRTPIGEGVSIAKQYYGVTANFYRQMAGIVLDTSQMWRQTTKVVLWSRMVQMNGRHF
jgi:hypothetical protein